MSKKIITMLLAAALATASLASCGGDTEATTEATTEAPKAEVTITELRDAIAAAYGEEYIANQPIPDGETLEMMFGIPADICAEFVAETPMIMTHIDTLIIVKPVEGKTADVVAALETYHEGQQMMQYPMNVAKAEAAEIYEKGGYVFYIRLGMLPEYADPEGLTGNETEEELEAIWAKVDADRLELAKANNKKAIDVIDGLLG